MIKTVPKIALSGFIFCLVYFASVITILVLSKSGVTMTQENNIYSAEQYRWRISSTGEILAIVQLVLFAAIWIHIVVFLRKFKEYFFIDIAIIVHLLWSLYTAYLNRSFLPHGIIMLITFGEALFMAVSLWFIKSKYLKSFARWYTLTVVAEFLLSYYILPFLYDNFNVRWAMINPYVLNLLPYSILTVMFMSIWVRSKTT